MSARRKARKRALDVLFEAEQRAVPVPEVLAQHRMLGDPPLPEYAQTLAEGVDGNRPRIDDLLTTYGGSWPLDRMPAVDRAILRVAVYELLFRDEVPDAVVIDEAVELAKQLSTDESPAFVNGLLSRILAVRPPAAVTAE